MLCNFEGSKKELSKEERKKDKRKGKRSEKTEIVLDSSMVEHPAVNRVVVGSSPTRGVKR